MYLSGVETQSCMFKQQNKSFSADAANIKKQTAARYGESSAKESIINNPEREAAPGAALPDAAEKPFVWAQKGR